MTFKSAICGCLILICQLAAAMAFAQDNIAIRNVTVIDGNGGAPARGATVLLEAGRISIVGDAGAVTIPAGSMIVEGDGKFLLPGFVDSNVHASIYGNSRRRETVVRYGDRNEELVLEFVQRQLMHGITTVRDSYGELMPLMAVRDRIERGEAVGARMLVAGNIVGWGGPFSMTFSLMQESDLTLFQAKWNDRIAQGVGEELMDMGPDEVGIAINQYLDKGPDFIKYGGTSHFSTPSLIGFSPRIQKVIVDETHKRGLIAETHATSPEALRMAVEAGIDLIQHPEILSREYPEDLLQLIVERGVLCAMRSNTLAGELWQQHLQQKQAAQESLVGAAQPQTSAEPRQREESLNLHYEIQRRNAERLIRAGCRVTIATDNYQGRAPEFRKQAKPVHQEAGVGSIMAIEGLVQLGMSESEAIVAATKNGAIAAGRLDELGTIAAGKVADLILLADDPLLDISNIRKLEQVIARGKIVDLGTLPEKRLFYLGPGRTSAKLDFNQPVTAAAATTATVAATQAETQPEQQAASESGETGTMLAIANIYETQRGSLVVELENGQVWRQLESDNTQVALPRDRSGLTADIKRSLFGSMTLAISGTGRSIKVSRIQ